MKLRFYFDYSDYRSYLMMHTICGLNDLPVQFQWIALDAYSLRALSGCGAPGECPRERDFFKQEAIRFCRHEGIDFVWQDTRFHSGSALHAGIWMMMHRSQDFEAFSRKMLALLWGEGKTADPILLKDVMTASDFNEMMHRSSERESFQIQDICLQQALSDGVFDVPSVVIGDQIVCHFDHGQEIRRLVLAEFFKTLPGDEVCNMLATVLQSLPHEEGKRRIEALMRKCGSTQTITASQKFDIGMIQHSLAVPNAVWRIPKQPVNKALSVHCIPPCQNLQDIINKAAIHAVSLCVNCENVSFDAPIPCPQNNTEFLLIAIRHDRSGHETFIIRGKNGNVTATPAGNDDVHFETFDGWKIALISPQASHDLNMARMAAHGGAHLIVTQGIRPPSCEAYGYLASAWLLNDIDGNVSISDSEAHRIELPHGETFKLNTTFKLPEAAYWTAPTPRTLLLCETALTFGDLSANADIELASLGLNLLVTTKQQASELSPSRVFEKFRIRSSTVLLLPLNNEQIFVPELISHRIVETLNQAPKDSYPILVSYWSDLEFEMLEQMRPVLAALSGQFRLPVILVVGRLVTEIWLPTQQGTAWRVEKDNDCFTIDLDELVRTDRYFDTILNALKLDENGFIQRLEDIAKINA